MLGLNPLLSDFAKDFWGMDCLPRMPEALVSVPSTVWNQLQWHMPATPALGSLRPAWAMTQKAKKKMEGKKKEQKSLLPF